LNASAHPPGAPAWKRGHHQPRALDVTIITEWDLVCERAPLPALAQTLFMAGVLLGAFIFGTLSDRWVPESWDSSDCTPTFLSGQPDPSCRGLYEGRVQLTLGRDLVGEGAGCGDWGHDCPLYPRVGRRWVLLSSLLTVGAGGTGAALAPDFIAYCVCRTLSGIGLAGFLINYIGLSLEWVPRGARAGVVTWLSYCSTAGQMVLAGLAYGVQDWRHLQLAISAPFLAFLLGAWWVPESARWLLVQGRTKEALRNLQRVARVNGRTAAGEGLSLEVLVQEGSCSSTGRSTGSWLGLFLSPALRRISCCLMCVSFSTNLAYFGLSMDLGSFGLDVFLVQLCFGAVDLGAKAACALALNRCGRRPVQALSLSVAGACLLASTPLPAGEPGDARVPCQVWGSCSGARCLGALWTWAGSGAGSTDTWALSHLQTTTHPSPCLSFPSAVQRFLSSLWFLSASSPTPEMLMVRLVLVVLGKGFLAAASVCSYLYGGELFPTVVRQTGTGLMTVVARLGGMVAPLVLVGGQYHPVLPPLVFGVTPVLAGAAACFLPEMRDVPLMDTIEQVEERARRKGPEPVVEVVSVSHIIRSTRI
ncbi:PREDICTED: solute carrier family 22 member 20-like, partial [Crocodylus porosus]|uniref:solute carrier family 22 member 20-like n=1 Tax=Crocodylus porosus TaxID=8502 RepID=UPI000939BB2B